MSNLMATFVADSFPMAEQGERAATTGSAFEPASWRGIRRA
jgi:hypothetical protein